MGSVPERIQDLDISLFDPIPSQTDAGDRRSLLAVQRATARTHGRFAYLEIGSHLGGSIQPYLVDPRCTRIYSIDPRPLQQPDDRSPGHVATYESNSSERMLSLLREVEPREVVKIQCFERDASEVDCSAIAPRPHVAFIDGEHTRKAVLSDFQFCRRVIAEDGTILFHDVFFVYPAILEICRELRRQRREFLALKLDGCVFGIFFDQEKVHSDPYLSRLSKRNRRFLLILLRFRLEQWLRGVLPDSVLASLRELKRRFGRRRVAGA